MNKRIPIAALVISAAGLLAINSHEEVRTEAYLDPVGIPTICAGVTRGVFLGQKRSLSECEQLLKEETDYAGRAIRRCTHVDLTQGQYDAVVDFTYNVGGAAYCGSTLVRRINAGDCHGAAREFDRWIFAKSKKLRGLIKRRADERQLFEADCP